MQRITVVVFLSVALVFGLGAAYAQQAQGQKAQQPAEPVASTPIPAGAVLMIYRCEVKPGHAIAQEKAAAATSRAIAKANGPLLLAMTTVTGPSEAWFVLPYNSLADIDKMNEATAKLPAAMRTELDQLNDVEGSHYNSMRGMLLRYREEMSLDASFNVSPYRAMEVVTYRVRPGRTREFVEGAKAVMAAYKKLNIGLRIAGFQVLGGAPAGTFMFFRPLKTATELVPPDSVQNAYMTAMGGQDALDKMDKALADILVSSDNAIFMFSPKMSNVAPSYAAADPFWKIAAPTVAKAEPKEGEAKKKAVEPVKK